MSIKILKQYLLECEKQNIEESFQGLIQYKLNGGL